MSRVLRFALLTLIFTGLLTMHVLSPVMAASECDEHTHGHVMTTHSEQGTPQATVAADHECPGAHDDHGCAGMVRETQDHITAVSLLSTVPDPLPPPSMIAAPTRGAHAGIVLQRKPDLDLLSISRT